MMCLAQGPLTTERWCFQKFYGENKSFEDNYHSGRTSDVNNDQLRAIVETNSHSITGSWANRRSSSEIAAYKPDLGQQKGINSGKNLEKT